MSPLVRSTPSTKYHQKSPSRLSTSYTLNIYVVNFKLPFYFPGCGDGWALKKTGNTQHYL